MPRRPRTPLRVALVNLRSPQDDWHQIVMVPLGAMYVASALKSALGERVEVRLFDMTLCPPREDPSAALREFLGGFRPAIVGLRGFTCHAAWFPLVAGIAKELDPTCLVVAGGPHAGSGSRALHAEPAIDLVVRGEGEQTVVELVESVLAGRDPRATAGVSWFEGGEVRQAPARPPIADLDAIARPDYAAIDLDAYQGHMTMCGFLPEGRFTSIFTSRGCHYRCTYCHDKFGKRVRYRSVRSVVDELDFLIHEHGVEEFHVVDDIFNADEKRAIAIFDAVVRRGWQVRFAFPNGLRGDIMTEEFVAAARAAGAYHWAIAVESASPRIQRQIRKHNRLDRVLNAIELSDRHGVFTCTFNMLGFPGETEAEMQATLDLNHASKAHMMFVFAVTPHEGTALHAELLAQGDDALSGGYHRFAPGAAAPELATVPRARIHELIVDATARFHFDHARMERMVALCPRGHSLPHLALMLEERRWSGGYDWGRFPDPRAGALLAEVNRRAKQLAPALCAHLPEPPLPA